MENLNIFLWILEKKKAKEIENILLDIGCSVVTWWGKNTPARKLLKKSNIAIIDENYLEKFEFPIFKIVVSEKEKEFVVNYKNLEEIKNIINYYKYFIFSYINLLPMPAFIMEKNGKILSANEKFLKIFQYEKAEGKDIEYFFLSIKKQMNRKKEPYFYIDFNFYNSKEFKEYVFRLNFIKVLGLYLVILKDETIQRKKEKLDFLYQKAEAIGKFSGGCTHDLNNLLMVISSYANLIEKKVETPDLKSFLAEINKAVDKAKDLSGKLLAFSGRQTLIPKVININDFLKTFIEKYKPEIPENISIELLLEKDMPFVKVDPEKFEKAIENILKNSLDAILDQGLILIETNLKIIDNKFKEFPIIPKGKWVQITITDTGAGMDEETCKKVFDPYFTTKPKGKGKGLGLSETYGFIKQSEGFIFCTSEEAIGTTIYIFLKPYEGSEKPTYEKIEETTLKEKSFEGKKVLIIEDEKELLSSLSMILASTGFEVIKSSSGEEAIELAKNINEKLDLIISDIVLPGIDGKEAVDKITKKMPGIPVIFMSGYSDSILAKHNVLKNNINFISKPFNVNDLMRRIQNILTK